jgi:hypothetical protein
MIYYVYIKFQASPSAIRVSQALLDIAQTFVQECAPDAPTTTER